MSLELSSIDSDRFGIVTAKCSDFIEDDIPHILEFSRQAKVELLIARCSAITGISVAQVLEKNGFFLTDTSVHSVFDVTNKALPVLEEDLGLRSFRLEDEPSVLSVARESFAGYCGHYHLDARLDRRACDEVYVDWTRHSCRSEDPRDAVFVSEIAGQIVGYVTTRMSSEFDGAAVLSGVTGSARRRGLYRALMIQAMHWCAEMGADRVNFVTQIQNLGVQRIWARLGFEPFDAFYTFHRWFDRDDADS